MQDLGKRFGADLVKALVKIAIICVYRTKLNPMYVLAILPSVCISTKLCLTAKTHKQFQCLFTTLIASAAATSTPCCMLLALLEFGLSTVDTSICITAIISQVIGGLYGFCILTIGCLLDILVKDDKENKIELFYVTIVAKLRALNPDEMYALETYMATKDEKYLSGHDRVLEIRKDYLPDRPCELPSWWNDIFNILALCTVVNHSGNADLDQSAETGSDSESDMDHTDLEGDEEHDDKENAAKLKEDLKRVVMSSDIVNLKFELPRLPTSGAEPSISSTPAQQTSTPTNPINQGRVIVPQVQATPSQVFSYMGGNKTLINVEIKQDLETKFNDFNSKYNLFINSISANCRTLPTNILAQTKALYEAIVSFGTTDFSRKAEELHFTCKVLITKYETSNKIRCDATYAMDDFFNIVKKLSHIADQLSNEIKAPRGLMRIKSVSLAAKCERLFGTRQESPPSDPNDIAEYNAAKSSMDDNLTKLIEEIRTRGALEPLKRAMDIYEDFSDHAQLLAAGDKQAAGTALADILPTLSNIIAQVEETVSVPRGHLYGDPNVSYAVYDVP